jgi:hypothetical protein
MRATLAFLALAPILWLAACSGGGSSDEDAGQDASADAGEDSGADSGPPPEPGTAFDPYCAGKTWQDTLAPATMGNRSSEYAGMYSSVKGTIDLQKFVPDHPFRVEKIRLAFAGSPGTARVRLMTTFGRSYPGGWPDLDAEGANLIAPVDVEVANPDKDAWVEIDVSDEGVYLLPTQHYAVVYQHLQDSPAPALAADALAEGEVSRSLMILPAEPTPYGIDGNFRIELAGSWFCAMDDADRWFAQDGDAPFVAEASQRAAFADLNGDGHDDLVLNASGPIAYFGDGQGGFADPGFDPFEDAPSAGMASFADVDNDGFVDAYAAYNISPDGDGDGVTLADGDCNGADALVHPGAAEVDNGYDDDCDGVADDGTDTADGDTDGYAIAEGDCDDTRADVYPGAPELLDARDNDCDLQVDEDFDNRILLNDGTGRFTRVPASGVEAFEPTAAAGFGDGDGDGRLDLYAGNWLAHYPDAAAVSDRYFTGNGDGTFTDAQASAGLVPAGGPYPCYGVLWNDYDNDGLQDIWVGNYGYAPNLLWNNMGSGQFIESGVYAGVAMDDVGPLGGNTFGADFGDFDNDGDMDLYTANIAHPRYQPASDPSTFLVNEGSPDFRFSDHREDLGFIYDEGDVNAAFGDFDNDMFVDIAVGSLYPGHFSRLYRNEGGAGFRDVSYETGTAVEDSVAVAWSDVDEDGDLDLVIADRTGPEYVHLFVNGIGRDNNWIELDLEGVTANRGAVGARVTLEAGGVSQMRDVLGGGGHANNQQSRIVHFGLAQEQAIAGVTVRWPGGGTETIEGLEPNHRYKVVQGSGTGTVVF